MSKMHAQDKKQFRAIGLSSVLLLVRQGLHHDTIVLVPHNV